MNHPNLQELSQRIHKTNKAAGWWDIPRPRVQTAWLVVTELAEATEAERANSYSDLKAFEDAIKTSEEVAKDPKFFNPEDYEESVSGMWPIIFENNIKDTFEDEIADAVIRLLDFAGSDGNTSELYVPTPTPVELGRSNEEAFFEVVWDLGEYTKDQDSDGYLITALAQLLAIAERHGFDLWHHVDLKLKYNATRSYKHGGKKF